MSATFAVVLSLVCLFVALAAAFAIRSGMASLTAPLF
jgi:hypothetical protein